MIAEPTTSKSLRPVDDRDGEHRPEASATDPFYADFYEAD